MDKFTGNLLRFIRQEQLLEQGDSLIVGYSGGADSTCLLYALSGLSALLKLRLYAVHVNHGLRGAESERDEQFCREMTARLGVPLQVVRADVRARSDQDGISEEEAGRLIRYQAFEEARSRLLKCGSDDGMRDPDGVGRDHDSSGSDRKGSRRVLIATAHHADDQAETILLNLFRGTGLPGLSGMRAKRGALIRPLLFASRREIVNWLGERGIPYVTDSTNLSDDYTRNFLRNRILPALSNHVNARAAQHVCMAGDFCSQADRYLREEAGAFLDSCACEAVGKVPDTDGKNIKIPHIPLKEKPQIFRRYVIIEALDRLHAPLRNIGERHLADLDKALFAGRGFHLDLPNGISADNLYRTTVLRLSEGEQSRDKHQISGGEKDGI